MSKSLFMAVFILLASLQIPQVSYSQESDAKVCIGDCMLIFPEKNISGERLNPHHTTPEHTYPKEINPQEPDIKNAIKDVFFDADQFTLDEVARDILKKIAEFLRNNKSVHLEIQGHCDERGGNDENIALGERRAAAVKTYLVSLGIDYRRLHVLSLGEEKPFCMQSNEECWRFNNRVHFLISK